MSGRQLITEWFTRIWGQEVDEAAVLQLRSPNMVSRGLADEAFRGNEAFLDLYRRARAVLKQPTATVEDVLEEGSKVAARISVRGLVAGRPVTLRGSVWARVEGGKVVDGDNMFDVAGFAASLGVAGPATIAELFERLSEEVFIEERGRGEAVVVLHGAPSSVDSLEPLVADLARDHRVLVPHMPGYGHSPAQRGAYDFDETLRRTERALLARGVTRATFIGFSGGAWRALSLAARRQVTPLRVVCLAGVASLSAEERAGFEGFAAALRGRTPLVDVATQRFFSAPHHTSPKARETARAWLEACAPEDLARELEAFAKNPAPALEAVRCRVCCITGELDVAAPPSKAKDISDRTHGVLHEVPATGHALLVERPELVVSLVRAFLAS